MVPRGRPRAVFDEECLRFIEISCFWVREGYEMTFSDLDIIQSQDYCCHYCHAMLTMLSRHPVIKNGRAYCKDHESLNHCNSCGETDAAISQSGLCKFCEHLMQGVNVTLEEA